MAIECEMDVYLRGKLFIQTILNLIRQTVSSLYLPRRNSRSHFHFHGNNETRKLVVYAEKDLKGNVVTSK
jgi:hypothetical protein